MKLVTLTNSPLFAMVDDADFDLANKYAWRAAPSRRTIYAATELHKLLIVTVNFYTIC